MDIADRYRYNSVDVATYIVARANSERLGINMTKLQKLLYITYGAYFAVYPEDGRLTNEHPQAWPYGPVFPTTRNRLLKRDFDDITLDEPAARQLHGDETIRGLVTFVFKGFGDWDASQLTQWSHKPNSPWEDTTMLDGFRWGMQIPDEYIYQYFNSIIGFRDEKKC